MKKTKLWKTVVLTTSVLSLALSLAGCKQAVEDNSSSNNEQLEKLQKENKRLKTRYVKPLQFDVNSISGIAVTKPNNPSGSRFAAQENDINLVAIKEDGSTEPAVALGTKDNTEITEATINPEEDAIYNYVTPENNVVANILEINQCKYELNDKEAGGYYIVFDGKSTFTYEDGTTKSTGSLIYVTPDGVERDIFGEAYLIDTSVNFYQTADNGSPYMDFDENGNAFFICGNKFYRYQPIANKLDDLTPANLPDLYFSSFCVSLDGKFIVTTCYEDDEYSVKAIKVADKSYKDIYTSSIPSSNFSSSNVIYLDKNHSFYFTTQSWATDGDATTEEYNGAENYLNRWDYEWYGSDKIEKIRYSRESEYFNPDIDDPTNGSGNLILCDEGIFVMQPTGWIWTNENVTPREGKWTGSKLVKLVDNNGQAIRCTIPSSLSGLTFAPPRYNEEVPEIDFKDTSTWYKPSYLSNGKGIAIIGKTFESKNQDTIYYYSDGQLKNLLAFDTDRQKINKMTLSDKSIIFNASGKNDSSYTKSVNLENGSVSVLKINGTVLNILASTGKEINTAAATEAKALFTVKIAEQDDLKVKAEIKNKILTITPTLPEGCTTVTYSCNGKALPLEIGSTTLVLDMTAYSSGVYPIYVTAIKGSLVYSSFVEIKYENQ